MDTFYFCGFGGVYQKYSPRKESAEEILMKALEKMRQLQIGWYALLREKN